MGLVYYLHENHKNQPKVGKFTIHVDCVGMNKVEILKTNSIFHETKPPEISRLSIKDPPLKSKNKHTTTRLDSQLS